MRDFDELFTGLARSRFRRRFRLGDRERRYLEQRGLETILEYAVHVIRRWLETGWE